MRQGRHGDVAEALAGGSMGNKNKILLLCLMPLERKMGMAEEAGHWPRGKSGKCWARWHYLVFARLLPEKTGTMRRQMAGGRQRLGVG